MNRESTTSQEPNDDDLGALLRSQNTPVPIDLDHRILTAAREAVNTPVTLRQHTAKKPRVAQWFAVAATLVVGISVAPLLLKAPESSLDSLAPQSSRTMPSPGLLNELTESDEIEEASGSSAGDSPVRATTQPASIKKESTNMAESTAKQKRLKSLVESTVITTPGKVEFIPSTTPGNAEIIKRTALSSENSSPGTVQSTPSTTPEFSRFDTNTLNLVRPTDSVSSETGAVLIEPNNEHNGLVQSLQRTKSLMQSNTASSNEASLNKPVSTYYRDSPDTWLYAIKLLVKRNHNETARLEYDLFRQRYPLYEPDFELNDITR